MNFSKWGYVSLMMGNAGDFYWRAVESMDWLATGVHTSYISWRRGCRMCFRDHLSLRSQKNEVLLQLKKEKELDEHGWSYDKYWLHVNAHAQNICSISYLQPCTAQCFMAGGNSTKYLSTFTFQVKCKLEFPCNRANIPIGKFLSWPQRLAYALQKGTALLTKLRISLFSAFNEKYSENTIVRSRKTKWQALLPV